MNNESDMTHVGDTFSLTILIGYFLAGLPTVALLLTVIWTALRIYETRTVQKWLGKKND